MMMRTLCLLLVICTLSAAKVPEFKEPLNTDEADYLSQPSTSESSNSIVFCAQRTPCAWRIYNKFTSAVTMTMVNTYCVCEPGLLCEEHEMDEAVHVFVMRCKSPDTLKS